MCICNKLHWRSTLSVTLSFSIHYESLPRHVSSTNNLRFSNISAYVIHTPYMIALPLHHNSVTNLNTCFCLYLQWYTVIAGYLILILSVCVCYQCMCVCTWKEPTPNPPSPCYHNLHSQTPSPYSCQHSFLDSLFFIHHRIHPLPSATPFHSLPG